MSIHETLHKARDAYHYLEWCKSPDHPDLSFDITRFRQEMVGVLTAAGTAFSLVTGVKCRVSIKVIGQTTDNNLYVTTLARDHVSVDQCAARDDSEDCQHLISKNTDFHLIMDGNLNYFFSNDLQVYTHYQNTSQDDYRKNNPIEVGVYRTNQRLYGQFVTFGKKMNAIQPWLVQMTTTAF